MINRRSQVILGSLVECSVRIETMQPGPGQTFLSPLPTGGTTVDNSTPQAFISPATKRRVGITSPTAFISPNFVNDDEAEKKERRRSKIVELQRRHLASPATPNDTRQTSGAPLSGLSNQQLSEHYTNCIKLSAENKINSKNAFGLHLIDYMSELLKKKEMTNFQVASSTLDASAKIYAGRVDAIHSETYKVLTGLGRGAEKAANDDGEEDECTITDEQDGPPGAKKRKKTRQGKTIETNLKNLNVPKLDLAFEMDPLFQKTSAAFDEGGTAGLLLNHLHCRDDTSELVLDSNAIMSEDGHMTIHAPPTATPGPMGDARKMFLSLKLNGAIICPEFADFEFMNWNSDSRDDGLGSVLQDIGKSSQHAFDLEADAETIPESTDTEDIPGDFNDDDFAPIDDNGDDDAASDAHNLSGRSMLLGDNKEAQMVQHTIKNIRHGEVGTLMQVLASEPSDYSYFNKNLLQTWAGPSYWKLRPKSKGEMTLPGPHGDAPKPPREKKEAFVISYEEMDFDKHFKQTRAATTLSKATLDGYSKAQTTLPEDLHYKESRLFKLFNKRKVMIKRQKRASTGDLDENIEEYDYENKNDIDNFCPAGNDDDGDDDNTGGFDFTVGTQSQQELDISTDMFAANYMEGDGCLGDNLIEQPRKVAKIDIGYAKTAKKLDVKRLKFSMWNLLTTPDKHPPSPQKDADKDTTDETEKTDPDPTDESGTDPVPASSPAPGPSSDPDHVAGPHSFQSMLKELPEKVSRNMAQNLSVPIAFVCLLHLANEKTLEIKSSEDMTDLTINQG